MEEAAGSLTGELIDKMTEEKISLKDFKKLALKVGKIIKVEEHANADKLYVLTVDLGEEKPRTIVAGIKEHYKKDQLKNKKAIFIANLEPAKIRGIESNGMLLVAVSDDKKEVAILQPEKNMSEGTRIS